MATAAFPVAVFAASAAVLVVGNALSLGVVWHERTVPEARRTLINRLIGNQCLICSAMVTAGLLHNMVMSVAAGVGAPLLHPAVCDVVQNALYALQECIVLNADLIIIFRYLYICRFKNVGVLDDDFLCPVATAVVAATSAYHSILSLTFGLHKNSLKWQNCVGIEKTTFDLPMDTSTAIGTLAFSSVVLHAVLFARMFKHEKAIANATVPAAARSANNVTQKSFVGLGTSVATFAAMILTVLGVLYVLKVAIARYGAGEAEAELLKTVAICSVILVAVPAAFYWRNADMRAKIFARWLPCKK